MIFKILYTNKCTNIFIWFAGVFELVMLLLTGKRIIKRSLVLSLEVLC